MQLLYSKAAPSPEFVSVSLLMRDDMEGSELPGRIREPLLIPSPISTVSQATGVEAVKELHLYVLSIFRATTASKEESRRMATAFLREDEKLLEDIQVYRPANGQGVGLHFKLFRDRSSMLPLIQLVLKSTKSGVSTATKGIENEVVGVLMCLGMAGLPSAFPVSSLHYSLPQRMKDCIEILKKTGVEEVDWSACLLATLLLTEEESRLSNTMATGADYHLFIEGDDNGRGGLLGGKRKIQDTTMDLDFENPLSVKSADQARIMVERLAVLSVVESDTIFKKYQGKAAEKGKSRRRKTGREADLDGFDFRGEKRSSRESATALSALTPPIKSLSSTLQLKKPKKDTARTGGGKNRTPSSVPALSASNRDTGGSRSRRSSFENARRQNSTSINRRGSGQGSGNFDPFAGNSIGTSSTTSETTTSSRRVGGGNFDTSDQSMDVGFRNGAFARDLSYGGTLAASSSGDVPRMQVNVALNEDLACFYKLSKMSSCTVEGVIQVQVKSNVDEGTPFFMSIRDPSEHIQSLQENKKFAEDRSDAKQKFFKFAVSVPKEDEYFPVMKYKCGSELRPVPIRVQTRVRLENPHWRVALQISSNPHNQYNLTDLTIIMGVPTVVRGETLITSPPGGVWNASKRSVIWCVSELGGGEKFQLQARFEIEPESEVSSEDTPKFPVLVRCQCMYDQLSDVQVDVGDVPEVCPADVRMKLARRFRLSHRERP